MDRTMPVFAEAYGYTPAQFRALTMADFGRLVKHLADKGGRR